MPGSKAFASTVAIANDGTVAVGGRDGVLRIWRTGSDEALTDMPGPLPPITHVSFSRDGLYVAAAGGNAVRVWELRSSAAVYAFESDLQLTAIAFGPTGINLLLGSRGLVLRWQPARGVLERIELVE